MVEVFLQVNNFTATASLRAPSLDLAFPLSLSSSPGGLSENYALMLALENGYFNMDAHVSLDKPRNITVMSQAGVFKFKGSLDVVFPVKLAASLLNEKLTATATCSQ